MTIDLVGNSGPRDSNSTANSPKSPVDTTEWFVTMHYGVVYGRKAWV